jgi:threonyl-tRNA synthetase
MEPPAEEARIQQERVTFFVNTMEDQQKLDQLRHSCAHLLAAAVMELWPNAKRTIGPAIEQGFYYDFDDLKVSEDDFPAIEAKMKELVKTWKGFERSEISKEEAMKRFSDNPYKQELIEEFAQEGQALTLYTSGVFADLCRGGHSPHPNNDIKHFKLLSVAGAYWRGSEKNKMLTRIYGTCFPTKVALDAYLTQQEEAKKRDHRKIGKAQELFLISQQAGSGFPIYQPKGFLLRRNLEQWLTAEKERRGYQFVWTPHVGKSDLYRQSGHWQKYDAMFNPMKLDEDEYVMKPMNCPHHFQIYLERPRSYRELPLRLAENATVYRFEKQGELNGLLRVRALTQDDSHIFVRHSQIAQEIDRILDLAVYIYKTFGFSDYRARISVRDPKHPDKYMGLPENWQQAEDALVAAVKKRDIPYFVGEGEAAFYGPKIDIMVRDAIGREWQLTTCQLDFVQPENFSMHYIGEEGKEEKPAVLHVAILGSFDRFLAVLIEHYGGAYPLWLSPVQVGIIPIAERHQEAAHKAAEALRTRGLRVNVDDRHDTMQAKIRDLTLQKVPYLGIIGDREADSGSVSVRTRTGEDLKAMSLEALADRLVNEIEHNT